MNKLVEIFNRLPEPVKRSVHTFWQTFFATVAVGITPVFTYIGAGQFEQAWVVMFALLGASVAAGLSAAKSYIAKKLS